jgi:hypothetical protein
MKVTMEEQKLYDDFTASVFQRGYEKGYEEGKGQTWSEETLKTESEMYAKGLNDAWECAKKIILTESEGGLSLGEHVEIFGAYPATIIFKNYTASEAIAKIKEYEEKDKHKCKECKWDEFRDAQHPVGTPCDSCFEGKNFSPKVARCCSVLDDICPYDIPCAECEVHCSVERAKQKLKGDKE